nr:Ig-like domain-containing protein [Auraticoccus monumenti]
MAPNLPPTAEDLSLRTGFEEPVELTLAGTDPEGRTLTYDVDDVVGGTVSGTAPELVFTPDELFSGEASFSYTVSDGRFTSEPADVTIDVAVNLPPTADDIELATEFETPVEVDLSGTDPEGLPLTFDVGTVVGGTVSGTAPDLVFTPDERFGGTASISYTVSDGRFTSETATVTIEVGRNEPPTAADLRLATGFETPVGFTLPGEDPEGVPLQWALVGEPAGGSLSETDESPRNEGLTEEERDALPPVTGGGWFDLVFTPDELFSGEASFSYVVFDGRFVSEPATVTVDVAGNAVPVADDLDVTTSAATPVDLPLTGSDPEGRPLTFEVTSSPEGGALSGTAPELVFTPEDGFSGEATFEFTVDDGRFTSEAATVTITVEAAAVEPTPAPVEPSPVPVEPSPVPVEPTPAPVEPGPTEPAPVPGVDDRLPDTGGLDVAALVVGLGLLTTGATVLLSRARRRD